MNLNICWSWRTSNWGRRCFAFGMFGLGVTLEGPCLVLHSWFLLSTQITFSVSVYPCLWVTKNVCNREHWRWMACPTTESQLWSRLGQTFAQPTTAVCYCFDFDCVLWTVLCAQCSMLLRTVFLSTYTSMYNLYVANRYTYGVIITIFIQFQWQNTPKLSMVYYFC